MKKFWNKAWFETICLVLISVCALLVGFAMDCSNKKDIKVQDIEYTENGQEVHYIDLYNECVIDFVYDPSGEFGVYTIQYADDDAFDYDNMSYEDDDWYSDNFIMIECSRDDFLGYMKYYDKLKGKKLFYETNRKYQIKEVIENGNYRFYLVKK